MYENNTYKVVIGKDEKDLTCYQIVNKNTGMVEQVTTIYPTAINMAREFERATKELMDEIERENRTVAVPSNELLLPRH